MGTRANDPQTRREHTIKVYFLREKLIRFAIFDHPQITRVFPRKKSNKRESRRVLSSHLPVLRVRFIFMGGNVLSIGRENMAVLAATILEFQQGPAACTLRATRIKTNSLERETGTN